MKVFGIAGWKNTGKTGLTERLVACFTARGLTVSTIKHAHHAARLDLPGSDTDRHRLAGAREVMLATDAGWSLVHAAPEPDLEALLARLAPVDLVLLEGFKQADVPKLLCHRQACRQSPDLSLPGVRAVASDMALDLALPVLPLDDTEAIANFIEDALR